MDNAALAMQVVETDEHLLGHATHDWQRYATVVVALHDFKQIDAQDLEDHDEVLAIGT